MTDNQPIPRPTEEKPPPQWDHADLSKANKEGRHGDIVEADRLGQFVELRAKDAAERNRTNVRSVRLGD